MKLADEEKATRPATESSPTLKRKFSDSTDVDYDREKRSDSGEFSYLYHLAKRDNQDSRSDVHENAPPEGGIVHGPKSVEDRLAAIERQITALDAKLEVLSAKLDRIRIARAASACLLA
ncbi:hypothetical protein XA68_18354 [Ophiocordyceps unilateralis]|uniref:Uncharacterized protein n=1 Tax=Ophiocordyceps unilateralis TaxID=268505 RepID=A0A2A9PJH0_OPHUN|nr:hypothetical protein XA68_18354 [Ophiocordyceps unilateralis]